MALKKAIKCGGIQQTEFGSKFYNLIKIQKKLFGKVYIYKNGKRS